MEKDIIQIAKNAKEAFLKTMTLSNETKNEALNKIAQNIKKNKDEIFKANKKDLEEAKILLEKKEINLSTFNRLKLDENKLKDIIQGIFDLIKLQDPVNQIIWQKKLDEDLILKKFQHQ